MQRTTLLALAFLVSATFVSPASAQWKWRDKSGVVQYSDLPPPPGIPSQDILQRSTTGRQGVPGSGPAASATPASGARGGDPELEARRRKSEQEKTDKSKAEERDQAERVAIAKADNCSRAKGHMKSLEEGLRMVRTNASGEREVLDDKARADEKARAREIIASDCK
ncbi:MAG: DUF4124 domain-containing protein [Burkholderiaceae bacterium]